MVLPPPTAPEGQASAPWLNELRRWLLLGHKGVIVMVRDAQPARLRELVEMLEEIERGFSFTTRADEIAESPPGGLVLLAVRDMDLDWLNLNRPLFAQRNLRAVLWADAAVSDAFRFKAPDLHDWVSHFVRCPPGVPRFALEGLRVGLKWWPGVAWRGEDLESALSSEGIHDHLTLNPSEEFETLITSLSASGSRPIRWVGVGTSHDVWRIRWALGWARHHGPNVLDNPAIVPAGWFEVCTHQLGVFDATERLHQAGIPEPCKAAARIELEPGPIQERATRTNPLDGKDLDDEILARVALLRAAAHVQRTLHEHEAVAETRRRLVRQLHRPSSSASAPSRFLLALFASAERDVPKWPNWQTFRLAVWTIEHALRTGADIEEKRTILRLMERMEQDDVLEFLAGRGWDRETIPARGPSEETFLDVDFDLIELHNTFSTLDPDVPALLGDELGWDTSVAVRALARTLLTMIENNKLEAMAKAITAALDAASSQLGNEDPDYGIVVRVVGIGLGIAGDHARASEMLEHARDILPETWDLRDSVLAELAMVYALRGRFTEALESLASATHVDSHAERAKRSIALASGARQPADHLAGKPTYLAKEARSYLRRRLHEIGNSQLNGWS